MTALLLMLASCSSVPTPSGQRAYLLGGKGQLEYAPGGMMAFTYSNEKSFQHATQAVTTIVGGLAIASVQKAQETTTQVASANASAVAKNAQNQATAQAALAAKESATSAAIKAGAEITPLKITPP